MYQSSYEGTELDKTIRYTLTPDLFGYNASDDVSDTVVIGTVDTYQVIKPAIAHLDVFMTDEFSYNSTTGGITYLGSGELYQLIGNVSIDYSVVNTIVHFGAAVNGVTIFESSSKLETATAIQSLGLSAYLNLSENDVVTIEVKANKIGTLEAYHIQGTITEVKPSLYE